MEYYSALRKAIQFAALWMGLASIMLSEVCQRERVISHIQDARKQWGNKGPMATETGAKGIGSLPMGKAWGRSGKVQCGIGGGTRSP